MVKKMKKPLALFLALVMCLGMVNFTALANETAGHEHNKDGWTCTQAEPVKTLNCEEEEHEHTDECFIPGNPVLTCEDESEEHEHGEECYAPGEPVLNCEKTEHTHGDECYTVTEGAWTCTAPVVEETEEEQIVFAPMAYAAARAAQPDVVHSLWIPVGHEFTFQFTPPIGQFVGDCTYDDEGDWGDVNNSNDEVITFNCGFVDSTFDYVDFSGRWVGDTLASSWGYGEFDLTIIALQVGTSTVDFRYHACDYWNSTYNRTLCSDVVERIVVTVYDPNERGFEVDTGDSDSYINPLTYNNQNVNWLSGNRGLVFEEGGEPTVISGQDLITIKPLNNRNSYTNVYVDNTATVGFEATAGQTTGTAQVKTTYGHYNPFYVQVLDNGGTIQNVEFVELQAFVDVVNVTVTKADTPTIDNNKVTITKTHSKGTVTVGEEFSYTITLSNSNDTDVTVNVTDVLDENLTFKSAGDSGKYNEETRTVTWENVIIPKRGNKNLTVFVTANKAGNVKNEAQVTLPDGTTKGGNDGSGVTVNGKTVKLTIVKNFDGVDEIPEGFAIQYTLNGETFTLTEDSADGWSVDAIMWSEVEFPAGEDVVLTETNTAVTDKNLTTTAKMDKAGDGTVSVTGQAITVNVNADAVESVVRITNTYAAVPNAPTEKEVNTAVRGTNRAAVVVDCQPDRHLPGYFDCYNEDKDDPGVNKHPGRVNIGVVQGNDKEGYTCDVTFLAEKYLAGYNSLKKTTGDKAHVLCDANGNTLTAEQANVTVHFEWNATDEKWVLADGQTTPVMFWTKCPDNTKPEEVSYKVQWIDAADDKVLKTETRTATIGTEVEVKDTDKTYSGYTFDEDNSKNILSSTLDSDKVVLKMYFTKDPILALEVNKSNAGFVPNTDGDRASVNYTVTVTNKSDIDLYGLKLTDVMTATPAASADGVTYTFRDWKVGETTPEIISGEPTDLTHTLWVVDRNTLFAKNTSVTLTYTVDIVNNSDEDVEVKLDNDATGESWKAQKPTTYKVRSFIMPLTDDDPSDVSGTGSSSAGGSTGGSSTGGTLSGKKYTVTYNWNLPDGADGTKPVDAKYKKGATVTVDTTYTSESTVTVDGKVYTFSGWSTADATIAEGKFTMPNNAVTISGTWTHTHVWNEKTDGNDHTVWADGKAPDCIHDGTAIYECACGETKEEVKSGSALGHDFTNATAVDNCADHHGADCTGHTYTCVRCNGALKDGHETKTEAHDMQEVPNSAVAPTRDTAGKAADMKCSKCDHVVIGAAIPALGQVTITVEFKDEAGNVVGTEEKFVTKGDQYDVTEEAGKLPEGYEANGDPADLTGTADGDKTVTVPVKKIEYTVTFNSNGGSAVASQTVKHGETVAQPAAPTRENYRFDGWYLNGTAYNFSTPVTGNIELVAQWTYVPPYVPTPDYTYTLNYSANGGVGAPASQSQTNDRNFTVSAVEPTREGYTFAGWALSAEAETAAYQAGSQIRVNTGYSLTLYAVWTPVEEDVEETQTPTTETPETTEPVESTEPTETPDEGEDLGDNDTPLTDLPETSEPPVEPTETPEPDESEDLGDNDTPLADVPQTGDSIGLWIVLALCSAAGLYCFFPKKKGQREA